jgi:sulfotransferase family protein
MSIRKKLHLMRLYATSLLQNGRDAECLGGIQTYCMFVGYPRTGHSLIGSLLDAHPRIVIAHESGVLKLFQHRFSRPQVFHLLLENSRKMASAGRNNNGYSYKVPNQWQGRFEGLQVLGDTSTAALRLYRDPGLIDFLRDKIATEIKFIHVIRNPYDVVATMSRHSPRRTLDTHIDLFFQFCSSVEQLKKKIQPARIHDVRLESFIENPKPHLEDLCAFLRVQAESRYLEDCASIVFKSAKKSRFDIEWNAESIARMRERMEAFSFLSGYDYDAKDASVTTRPSEERSRLQSCLGILTTGKLLLGAAYAMTDGMLTSLLA